MSSSKNSQTFFVDMRCRKNIVLLIIANKFPFIFQGNFNFCKMTLKLLNINQIF
jgi:hypothetical protein